MKKFIFAALTALSLTPCVQAQTDFRHISYEEALQASGNEGKLLFIDFYTTWCGPCKRMASQVFPTKEVGDYMNAKFVALKIDAEKGEGPALAKKYGVRAYPTFVICDANGTLIGEFSGARDVSEFISKVESSCNPDLNPARVKELYEAGDRTPQIVQTYASNIVENSRDYLAGMVEATKIIEDYWNGLSDSQRLDPVNMFVYESYPINYNSPLRAFIVENRDKFDPSKADGIKKVLDNIYNDQANRFLIKFVDDDATRNTYEDFKASCRQLGYDNNFAQIFMLADNRAGMTCSEYVTFVDNNFDSLSSENRGMLMSSLREAFNPQTPEETKAVSDFARRHIASLPVDQLLWTAYSIHDLESPKH